MRTAGTLCLLTLASGLLVSAQLGCDSTMKTVKGCGADSECPMGTICRASDGRCIVPPPTIKLEVVLSGDGTGAVTSSPAGISCGASCSSAFQVGQKATLTATPAAGSRVAGFSIGCTSQTATCEITPDGTIDPLRVMVNFSLDNTAPPPALCNEYGFCWENPRPLGNRLRRVIVPSQGELIAVGDAGTVLRRSSGSFSLIPTGTDRNLNALWGTAFDHYIVGDAGTVLRFQTSFYSAEAGASGNLFDVYGGAGTIFAVGSGGTIVRRGTGGSWSADTSGTTQDLWGVWGPSVTSLTAVGGGGTYSRSPATGTMWTSAVEAGYSAYTFRGYAGSGTTGYAVDSFGGIARYTGTWSQVYRDALADNFYGIGIVAGTPYTAGGNPGGTGAIRRYDGTNWVRDVTLAPNTFYGIAGSAANDIWAVGDAGTVWQSDGGSWQARSSGLTNHLAAVSAYDLQNVWAVGQAGAVLRYNGTYFSPVNIGTITTSLSAVQAVTSSDVWAVGSSGQTWHYTGSTWGQVDAKTSMTLNGVAGLTSNQVYAVGDGGTIRLYDGTSWQIVSSGSSSTLRRVVVVGASEIWAVGDGGIVQRSSGGAFSPVAIPGPVTANLYDVWANSGSLWVLADNAVYRYAGGSWSTLPSPGVTGLRALSGTGPGDLWAVGLGGVIVRYNGSSWSREKSGVGTDLSSIAINGTRVWISGSNGTVLRKNL